MGISFPRLNGEAVPQNLECETGIGYRSCSLFASHNWSVNLCLEIWERLLFTWSPLFSC